MAQLVGDIPFSYLGMPVGGNSRVSTWVPLIDKFNKKLSMWKARSFSMGGRLTLIKSLLGDLGIYLF